MEAWYPKANVVRADRDGGSYTSGPLKGVLHTTESYGYTPSSSSYYGHQNWPHMTWLFDKSRGVVRIYQHIPFTRSARALVNKSGGVQTNRDSAIQLEICWKAAEAQNMPRVLLDELREFMLWAKGNLGIPLESGLTFKPYPASYGNNGVRLTGAEWDSFSGWCGHQHVPENSHGDPGAIDIAYLLRKPRRSKLFILNPGDENLYLYSEGKVIYIPDPNDFWELVREGVPVLDISAGFFQNIQRAQ